LPTTPPKYNYN